MPLERDDDAPRSEAVDTAPHLCNPSAGNIIDLTTSIQEIRCQCFFMFSQASGRFSSPRMSLCMFGKDGIWPVSRISSIRSSDISSSTTKCISLTSQNRFHSRWYLRMSTILASCSTTVNVLPEYREHWIISLQASSFFSFSYWLGVRHFKEIPWTSWMNSCNSLWISLCLFTGGIPSNFAETTWMLKNAPHPPDVSFMFIESAPKS
mmetsp:Transcript_28032/g.54512  ORF Transcript_28032/g.54512 Transcript_28032/m.54512 type:complete len:207 (+) Transcript_28032:51-671(+)